MKEYLININKILFSFLVISFIQCKTVYVPHKKGNLNEAILNSIQDFTKTHESVIKKYDKFYIGYEIHDDYYQIMILGSERKYLFNPNKNPDENKFPSGFLEENNKLFIWYDEDKKIDENTIQTYLRFDLLVDNQNETIFFLDDIMDDGIKATVYYICINDLTNFKKSITNYVKPSHPRLNCN